MFKSKSKKKNEQEKLKQFKELIPLIYKDLYKFIFLIVKNKNLSEDILQETLIQAYENFHSLKDIDKFKPWIFTIARRKALEVIKKYKREIPSEAPILELLDDDEYTLPEDTIITKELTDVMVNGINSLKSDQRDIIHLRYYLGMSFDEIASTLNINHNTVRVKHMRAKKYLFKYLMNSYFKNTELHSNLERKME